MIYISIVLLILIIILIINSILSKTKRIKLSEPISEYGDKEILRYANELSNLIRCATVSNIKEVDEREFENFREELQKMFPNVYSKCDIKIMGEGCLIYKLEGRNKSRNIMIMSHHDVVSAEGQWNYPAFSGKIIDGKLWGRGTVDTKTSFYAELKAIEELLESGFIPEVNVYIGSSNNEEVAGNGIPLAVEYFKSKGIRFELVLDEGGAIINAPLPGIDVKTAMIAVHEKGRKKLKCISSAQLGHASFSKKDGGPIIKMAKFIEEVNRKKPFVKKLHPEMMGMFKALNPYMKFHYRIIFSNLWLFSPILKMILPKVNLQGEAMLGTTCTFTAINEVKDNNEKVKAIEAIAFLQCINDEDLKIDIEKIKLIGKKYNIEIVDMDGEYHKPTNLNEDGYKYVNHIVNKVFPNVAVAPFILPAGSDSRHMTEICNCTLRFAPIDITPQQFASIHNNDENINIEAIGKAVTFYKELVKNYK